MSECHDNMNHNSRIAQTIAKDYVDDKIKQRFDN
jgi:hypothetical protein